MYHDQEPDQDIDRVLQDFTNLVTALLVDMEQGLTYYNSLFERYIPSNSHTSICLSQLRKISAALSSFSLLLFIMIHDNKMYIRYIYQRHINVFYFISW